MNDRKVIEAKGNAAVKQLRQEKLKNGLPFMFNSKELSPFQCYLEYPNGTIFLVEMTSSSKEFMEIRELTQMEIQQLLIRYNLIQ
jgi:hypothetical protein